MAVSISEGIGLSKKSRFPLCPPGGLSSVTEYKLCVLYHQNVIKELTKGKAEERSTELSFNFRTS